MNRVRLEIYGRLNSHLSYHFLQSFNKYSNPYSVDNMSSSIEYANIKCHHKSGKFDLVAGKQYLAVAGYEGYVNGLLDGVDGSKIPVLGTVNWNGWFADRTIHLMYSASAGQLAKGKNVYYFMCGNIYEKGPVLAYLDVLYSRLAIDSQP